MKSVVKNSWLNLVSMKFTKKINFIFKFTIIIISYGFIVYKLFQYDELYNVIKQFQLTGDRFLIFFAVIFLMFINWGIEALKWKLLINKLESISILSSLKAVFSGITISIFTPYSVGEFGGRIFVLKKENRISAIFSTIVGSMSQLLITIVMGLLSIGLLLLYFPEKTTFSEYNYITFTLLFIITGLITYIFLNIKIISFVFNKLPYIKKYNKYFHILSSYQGKELIKVLVLSLIRYFVFAGQFYLLLNYFGVNIEIMYAFISIALTYFFMTLIPKITLLEIGIRGSVALFFIGMFAGEVVGIVSASVVLWVINLAVPALIGSVVFYRMNI